MAEDEGSKEQRERMLEGDEELPGGTGTDEYPPIDFNTFVLSLSTSALMNLGMVADPDAESEPEVNLPLAKQTIDLIAVLEEKTKGNLTGEEERLVEQVLYDLRMRYLETLKKA
ncbi:MAG: DUF1844 domain-containing protein [Polyangiales bacterium]